MSLVKVSLKAWAVALIVQMGVLVSAEEGVGKGLCPGSMRRFAGRTIWPGSPGKAPACAAQDSASARGFISPTARGGFQGFVSGTCCSVGRQPDVGTRGAHL